MQFSIVIANYNTGAYIERAIRSVLSQSIKDYELIVVDGGSNDNSVEIIRKYEDNITWWVSEPDKGQSDAFNKGFSHATGDYFLWLNADDMLLPKALEYASQSINAHPSLKWFFGNTVYVDSNDRIVDVSWGCNFSLWVTNRGHIIPSGPTTFFHRTIFEQFGPFEVSYHYTMDGDLWRKFANGGTHFKMINHFCWVFRLHEDSKTTSVFLGGTNPKVNEEYRKQIEFNHVNKKWYVIAYQKSKRLFFSYPIQFFGKFLFRGKSIYNTIFWEGAIE